ncbi:hypothetical protein BLA39750_01035 [Burkholderia lata]|uniref:RES domain-containing protein n=1 Tax=Burkholderia lata (strain ATCC 17760 / DSM 23089 / LMG 22485 / NCIMB 9086 / R18194 / 383) TaxID=482957 RepID=A0A6P2UU59_BURL3|nr:RES family NAD+ phosphorylase [Burkholderia lata]VWC78649.1 hypothetical protein BLA39750_01035 [Burkholderia lata]
MKDSNRICANCVTDPYLRREIGRSETINEQCDYCEEIGPTYSMVDLAARCDKVIDRFYTLTSDDWAVVHFDRAPRGEQLLTILSQWLNPEDETSTYDLDSVLRDGWGNSDSSKYDDDPWFIREDASTGEFGAAWHRMELSLREEARLVNPAVVETLERVFGGIHGDRTEDGRGAILEVGPDRDIHTLFRARVFETEQAMERALEHPERELGPPAPVFVTAGRMNAKGVSVFYGARDERTALREVRPPVGSNVVTVAFRIVRSLRLLDLTALRTTRVDPSRSLFDPETAPLVERVAFLKQLEAKLTMAVMPSMADDGYLITQAVADYLSTHPTLSLDGIYFRSVQSKAKSDDAGGHNVILFHKAASVRHAREDDKIPTHANLWFRPDEDEWYVPSITTLSPTAQTSRPSWQRTDGRTPALELLRDTLSIHKVEGAEIETTTTRVQHSVEQDHSSRFRKGT